MAVTRVSLIVLDDDADTREVLSDLLTNHGYDVRTAATGEEALQLADEEPPQVVLLDIGLPDMDGTLVAALCAKALALT